MSTDSSNLSRGPTLSRRINYCRGGRTAAIARHVSFAQITCKITILCTINRNVNTVKNRLQKNSGNRSTRIQ